MNRGKWTVSMALAAACVFGWAGRAAAAPALAWVSQMGTASSDRANSVAVDGFGNVYITGDTTGSLDGTNQGNHDAFLAKYTSTGSLAWKTQIGTSSNDIAYGVAVDSFGSAYITGCTDGNLAGTNHGGDEAFLARYSSTGSLIWKTQLGPSSRAMGVAVDAETNVYITGSTGGNLGGTNQGGNDAFLARYNYMGNLVWKTQLGTSEADAADGVAVDRNGNVYIAGSTQGSLGGTNQEGSLDTFVAKYGPGGGWLGKPRSAHRPMS